MIAAVWEALRTLYAATIITTLVAILVCIVWNLST